MPNDAKHHASENCKAIERSLVIAMHTQYEPRRGSVVVSTSPSTPTFGMGMGIKRKSGKSCCSYHFLVSKMRLELTRTIVHYPLKVVRLPIPPPGPCCFAACTARLGAKNGTRTRDPDLGKVVLYQLSYFRNFALSERLSLVCGYKISTFYQTYQIF